MAQQFDVVIVGASFGGLAAALAAASDSKVSVVLIEASTWIGGQATAQGVTRWDEAGMEFMESTGSTRSYRALRDVIRTWYRTNAPLSAFGTSQRFFNPGFARPNYPFAADPSVVQIVLRDLVARSPKLTLRTGESIVSAAVANGSVQSITTSTGQTYTARVFLDATDLGDVLPHLGIAWNIGAEAHADTQEPDAPAQPHPEWIQPVTVPIAIEHRPSGENHTIAKPANFDDIARKQNFRLVDGDINGVFRPLPGGAESLFGYRQYVDARNFGGGDYATDRTTLNVGSNDYMDATLPTGSAQGDADVYAGARDASLAYLYWLQTRVSRDDGNGTGYPNLMPRKDAFGTNDGCAPQAYIRESRRIVSEVRIVQQDIDKSAFPPGSTRGTRFADSCGIGWYGIDIHAAQGPGTPWLGFETLRFQIPLGALLSKELDNFVASCKNIGTTHLTSGAYRVHPVEWAIGEAAGVLAAMSVTQNVTPRVLWNRDDRLASYQSRLLARGVPIFWWSDVLFEDDPRAFAAAHVCGARGIFFGAGDLRFVPSGIVSGDVEQTLNVRLGRDLTWPSGSMTRAQAAVFICEQMGWPIG
jgi:hypothetical protein